MSIPTSPHFVFLENTANAIYQNLFSLSTWGLEGVITLPLCQIDNDRCIIKSTSVDTGMLLHSVRMQDNELVPSLHEMPRVTCFQLAKQKQKIPKAFVVYMWSFFKKRHMYRANRFPANGETNKKITFHEHFCEDVSIKNLWYYLVYICLVDRVTMLIHLAPNLSPFLVPQPVNLGCQ